MLAQHRRDQVSRAMLIATALLGCSRSSALECAPIGGLDPFLVPGATVLVGELHGTVETPAFVGDLACHSLRAGHPTVIALELPDSEQDRLDAALESGDRAALLAGAFWSRPATEQDGRSSAAMADLVLRAHAFREAGWPVSLFAFDRTVAPPTAPTPRRPDMSQRDRAMADAITSALASHEGATLIALTGNLHGRETPGLPWDPGYITMGSVLSGRGSVSSVLVRASNGSAWNCQADGCASRPFGDPKAPAAAPGIVAQPTDGYDAVVDVGRFTASAPATAAP